jgi:hypothetical protein
VGVAAPEAEDDATGEAEPELQAAHNVDNVSKVQMRKIRAGIREITNPS